MLQRDEVAKIEKMIKKKEMTVRKFEKKWVPPSMEDSKAEFLNRIAHEALDAWRSFVHTVSQ